MARLVRNPEVVCTELEDGAVLLNLEPRLYYSLNGMGLEIWRLVESAKGEDEFTKQLLNRFEVDEARLRASISTFVDELRREQLLVEDGTPVDPSSAPGGEVLDAGQARRVFVEPELVRHDEPLHEVSTSPFDPQLPLAE